MDAAQDPPPASFLKRMFRWIDDFERSIELQPVDRLERPIAGLSEGGAARSANPSNQAREI